MTALTQGPAHKARRTRQPRTQRRGLTLIEVLIVIAILLALGGLVVVNLLPKKAEADINIQKADFDVIHGAMKMFRLDMGRYPSDDEGVKALWSKDAIDDEDAQTDWKGPYLETPKPQDNWGSDWVYNQQSEQMPSMYELVSIGPDKEEGTADDISNLDRWRDDEGEMSEEFDDFAMPDGDTAGGG